MTKQLVGEALVDLLSQYGVNVVFGIPGVHNIELYRALPASTITHVLGRHEQGVGFMADGYARATGKPGVCFTITGPGMTNIMTSLGQAWSDSSPILVISSCLDLRDSAQGRGRLHEMIDQFGAASSVTAHAFRVYNGKDLQDAVAAAFAVFASARPRPVYIEIPIDVLQADVTDRWLARTLPRKPLPDPALIEDAAKLISQASRTAIILGGGALDAGKYALDLAEKVGACIITTTAGKGAVPAEHGAVWGSVLSLASVQQDLQTFDCIVAVGTEMAETDFWRTDISFPGKIVRIDLDAFNIARPYPAAVAIIGDSSHCLENISARIGVLKRRFRPSTNFVMETPAGSSLVAKILFAIRAAVPVEAVICSDMTQIAYSANVQFPVSRPRTWLHPVGFGTLGFALPAAIGAKIGKGGSAPVVALAGDYGFQYTSNELATAVELNLTLPIVLWNNSLLGEIRDSMMTAGIEPNAVTARNPDFCALAKAYGAKAVKPATAGDLYTMIKDALDTNGPTLIEITPDITF
ncbi:5-guanidino-2-oxopentanoate decarboxylase [Mesorhizobium caraganae]|uniref:5-guanidino-2-oxopentanoate decarboxylase n=1 Tax=Mesorhizobium caraganae TaxID=483206 RepID=UPI001939DEC1|nr:5-guanidino-2-oxopentanoate decarboxylase [Mesorhizobium caraganae]MBM2715016.1 5-guanidino-2-oxopentanoate decarboxylase [Mesorhizobium caraganae]